MSKVYKATVGVKLLRKMFRMSSLHGVLADAVLEAQGTKPLHDDHFLEVSRINSDTMLRLSNDDKGYVLTVDSDGVTYTHDLYGKRSFDFDSFIKEFRALWGILNNVLEIKSVRRIGFVTEYRFPMKNPSEKLVGSLIKVPSSGYHDKFQLIFESRVPTGSGGLPDATKDDFISTIRQYYDSSLDSEHPESDHINATLDVQHYYAPALKGGIPAEFEKLKHEHEKAERSFIENLASFGLTHG